MTSPLPSFSPNRVPASPSQDNFSSESSERESLSPRSATEQPLIHLTGMKRSLALMRSSSSSDNLSDAKRPRKEAITSTNAQQRFAADMAALKTDEVGVNTSMLVRYSMYHSQGFSAYIKKPAPDNVISSTYDIGLKLLTSLGSPEYMQRAIENFDDSIGQVDNIVEPVIPLRSAHNLILIHANDRLHRDEPDARKERLKSAFLRGLEVIEAVMGQLNSLSNIEDNNLQEPFETEHLIGKICAHAMQHWPLFSKEEKAKWVKTIRHLMEKEPNFLDMTYAPFHQHLLAELFINHPDEKERQEFVEMLENKAKLNAQGQQEGQVYPRLYGASNLLMDVHVAQWKKDSTPERLNKVIEEITALAKDKRNWSTKSAILRFFDLFLHADATAKKQISATVTGLIKEMQDIRKEMHYLENDGYFGTISVENAYSRVALATMLLHSPGEITVLWQKEKESASGRDMLFSAPTTMSRILRWVENSLQYIKSDIFNSHGTRSKISDTSSKKDRLVYLKCACDAALLLIKIKNNAASWFSMMDADTQREIDTQLLRITTSLDNVKGKNISTEEGRVDGYAEQDEGYVEMNRYLQQYVEKEDAVS